MTLHWLDLALVVAIVVTVCGASYLLVVGTMRRMVAEIRRDMDRRLAALTEATMMRAAAPAEGDSAMDTLAANEIETEQAATGGKFAGPTPHVESRVEASQEEEEIPAAIQAAIAAAAIAAFGNHARVRSARQIPSSNVVSPWTQQGRVIVQSSHNLRTQGSR